MLTLLPEEMLLVSDMGVCERVTMPLSLSNDSDLCGELLSLPTLNTDEELILMEDERVEIFETMDDEESFLLSVEM